MITILIIIATVVVSMVCFKNVGLSERLNFNPTRIFQKKEYHRFLSHGFVHGDWVHLLVNMFVFFSFGNYVENSFAQFESEKIISSSSLSFILLYFGGMVVASIHSFIQHKNNPWYRSVGASGAVSAVLFTSIFLSPLEKIYFYGVLPVPGILFGILYLLYSSYMNKKSDDNINHNAHFWGAVYGFIFPVFLDFGLINRFFNSLFS
ncbi:MAG: rhomboid family intramembrane serine protease [Bacteroidales bacterium]|nr:rhomboid family intramembrane serine protease [Bacteroidales bacterium]MCF8391338.1 rhomboid family intramembrane serine protease [Bacteroidales bacterium]